MFVTITVDVQPVLGLVLPQRIECPGEMPLDVRECLAGWLKRAGVDAHGPASIADAFLVSPPNIVTPDRLANLESLSAEIRRLTDELVRFLGGR